MDEDELRDKRERFENYDQYESGAPAFTEAELSRLLGADETERGRPGPLQTAPDPDEEYRKAYRHHRIRIEDLQTQIMQLPPSKRALREQLTEELVDLTKQAAAFTAKYREARVREAMSKPIPLSPEAEAAKKRAIADGTYKPYREPEPLHDAYAEEEGRNSGSGAKLARDLKEAAYKRWLEEYEPPVYEASEADFSGSTRVISPPKESK